MDQDLADQVRAADRALPRLSPPAAVYVGEVHDQFPDHLNQLAVISALRERGLDVAVGMEMVQTPFQGPLDDYISGAIDFETMLARTEYFTRWRYDARHYAPIFQYARTHGLPLIALNASRELTDRVSEVGIAGLTERERSALPDELTPIAPAYRAMLEAVFGEHEPSEGAALGRFIDVQTTWDEVMGARSAAFLRDNPGHVLVVLAGARHVAHGHGIPSRVENALGMDGVVVLSERLRDHMPDGADVFLETMAVSLPEGGRMGVYINDTDAGPVIGGFAEDSPAQRAGAEKDDVITRVNDRPVARFGDVKVALWDRLPGDAVRLEVQRPSGSRTTLSFELR